MVSEYKRCTLCPRECGAERVSGKRGACMADSKMTVARAALHFWEEPCISGDRGSGAVFFSGCSLGCVYCQNRKIARMQSGREITEKRLAEIFLELQDQGAANINLVTACHYAPQVKNALETAKSRGLTLPVVYNSGGYEKKETLKMLEGYVDVYLPDYKYHDRDLAEKFSRAPGYPEAAQDAIREMVRQTGECRFDENGYIQKGTIVRHLILPGHTRNSIDALTWLYRTFGDIIYISIMNQFTPVQSIPEYPELNRRVTPREYEKVVEYALDLGIRNGFTQEGTAAAESFIPEFDGSGV